MKQVITFCEPQWIGKETGSMFDKGYWSIKVIREFTPRFLDKILGRKPYSKESIYTNLSKYPMASGWRNSNGDEIEAYSGFGVGQGERLKYHLEKYLAHQEITKIQNRVIKS